MTATVLLNSCSDNTVTKTLYGTWDPILEAADSSNEWKNTSENFLLSVSGTCEEIEITKTAKGDLANPDVKMDKAKCSGNRDELTFTDTEDANTIYTLKMDTSKDTLTGLATTAIDGNEKPYVLKIKFLRLGGI